MFPQCTSQGHHGAKSDLPECVCWVCAPKILKSSTGLKMRLFAKHTPWMWETPSKILIILWHHVSPKYLWGDFGSLQTLSVLALVSLTSSPDQKLQCERMPYLAIF